MNFYLPASGQVIPDYLLQRSTGFSPDTDPSALAANGIYTVIPATNPYDPFLYQATATYTVVGDYAQQGWTATGWDLADAKQGGSFESKQTANAATDRSVCDCGLSNELLTGVASQDPLARPARFQAELDEMTAISNQLDADLAAIDAATSVDEINNIVNKPTGTINIGRGEYGGPYDLNASNYVSFNSVSMTESETELYAPATSSVVPYQGYPPDDFNSGGPIFTLGNYLIQIRETATGMVIAEFEVPLSTDGSNEDIAF